jgi:GntR family transcriptional regulator
MRDRDGEARPGERLPPARDLAAVMGVNADTVLRAMRVLREEGLLEFRRGHGIRVAGHRSAAPSSPAHAGSCASRASRATTDELVAIIQSLH